MRDKSHNRQVEKWANFILANPTKWRKQHTAFINAQIENANNFYKRLYTQPNGKEIIASLREARLNNYK
ncbi:MAG: hypothetical protein ACI9P9_000745 [Patescibacteria group bacterium]|jgi:hypothetical protein